jgi:hypothetical protein
MVVWGEGGGCGLEPGERGQLPGRGRSCWGAATAGRRSDHVSPSADRVYLPREAHCTGAGWAEAWPRAPSNQLTLACLSAPPCLAPLQMTELAALVGESYERAYTDMVRGCTTVL